MGKIFDKATPATEQWGKKSWGTQRRRGSATTSNMTLLVTLGCGIQVHQLLCGRDISRDVDSDPMCAAAASMANFIYFVVNPATACCTVIDAAWDIDGIFTFARERLGARITRAVYTHRHFDHTGGTIPPYIVGGAKVRVQGVNEVVGKPECTFVGVGAGDVEAVAKQSGVTVEQLHRLEEGFEMPMGTSGRSGDSCCRLRVLQTPGHTPGSVCLLLCCAPSSSSAHACEQQVLFSGDTLFIGGSGRVDLPESNPRDMVASLIGLSELDGSTIVCPGHNYAAVTKSTIGRENVHNMAMLQARAQAGAVKDGAGLTARRVHGGDDGLPSCCCSGGAKRAFQGLL